MVTISLFNKKKDLSFGLWDLESLRTSSWHQMSFSEVPVLGRDFQTILTCDNIPTHNTCDCDIYIINLDQLRLLA